MFRKYNWIVKIIIRFSVVKWKKREEFKRKGEEKKGWGKMRKRDEFEMIFLRKKEKIHIKIDAVFADVPLTLFLLCLNAIK